MRLHDPSSHIGDRPGTLRYRCLVVDHDDTAVRSTPEIHYPAYCAMLRALRPGVECPSLEGFFVILHRGFAEHLRGEQGFTKAEMREEYRIWRGHVADSVPAFYPGFVEVLRRFGAAGGLIVVVSHSDEEIIRRDYAAGAPGLELGAVYGWNEDERRRKPATRPLREIEARHGLSPRDILVVDDLRPGVVMAQGVGADVAAAGWAHRIPEIEAYMREACTFYLEQTAELAAVLGLG